MKKCLHFFNEEGSQGTQNLLCNVPTTTVRKSKFCRDVKKAYITWKVAKYVTHFTFYMFQSFQFYIILQLLDKNLQT